MTYMLFKCGSTTMELIPDKFFPTTQPKLNKLINIILHEAADPWEYLEEIREYMQERLQWLQQKRSYYCYKDEDPAEDCDIDKYYVDLQHKAVSKTMNLIIKTQERLNKNYEIIQGICEDKK